MGTSCYCGKFPSFETPLLGTSHALSSFPPTTIVMAPVVLPVSTLFPVFPGEDYMSASFYASPPGPLGSTMSSTDIVLQWTGCAANVSVFVEWRPETVVPGERTRFTAHLLPTVHGVQHLDRALIRSVSHYWICCDYY